MRRLAATTTPAAAAAIAEPWGDGKTRRGGAGASRRAAGDSDQGVRQFVVARYGDFVLLRPPFNMSTLLLWLGPPALLLATLAMLLVQSRRARLQAQSAAKPVLTSDEEARLAKLVGDDERI